MKAKTKTLCRTVLNGKTYYEYWDGSAGTKELDEDDFLSHIDQALEDGNYITITEESLEDTIINNCKHNSDVLDDFQSGVSDSATTLQTLSELADGRYNLKKWHEGICDKLDGLSVIYMPLLENAWQVVMFEALVEKFCRENNLRSDWYISLDDAKDVAGE